MLKIKTIAKGAAALLLLSGTIKFCHKQTDGFYLTKIQNNTFETDSSFCSSEEEARALNFLSQPYTYLARGKQSFVFLSQDGKWVLKLLNNHYQSRIALLNMLGPCAWQKRELSYYSGKMELTRESYKISYTDLKEETGVLYLHLNRSRHLKQRVKIVDRLGICHEVDLDSTAFIIQKRGELAYPQFEEWLGKGDIEAAKRGISSLVALVQTRFKKDLNDRDPLIRTNIGFIDGKASFLDLGPFSKSSEPKSPEALDAEMQKITQSLKNWLSERDPSLALFLSEQCASLSKNQKE
ncbi:MAG: hypothetical protein HYX48_05735 [Chlamydiales bacterium]|nr:hypothetical protein [Chlamydiales bacterium]